MTLSNIPLIASHFMQAHWRWNHLRGAALERYQERRARQIVAYTFQHAPFYREHWARDASQAAQHWRTLPTVDKQLMMEHFDTFNTRGISREAAMEVALRAERSRDFRPVLNGLTIGLSSGTSGHRGLFVESAFNAPVQQIYQCTEGLLALSCARRSLHIQEDVVILQFEPLPGSNGERVMPIVTDLTNSCYAALFVCMGSAKCSQLLVQVAYLCAQSQRWKCPSMWYWHCSI